MTFWQLLFKRTALLAIGCGLAYVALLEGRIHHADPETNGVWAGALGMAAMDLLENVIPPRKKR